ncbi:MAG: hypothetical protein ACRDSE_14720 [Pseudonocardiaceae bacterium]
MRVGLGDAEDGHEGAGAGDLDFGDQGLDQGFAGLVGAGVDGVGDVLGHFGEGGRVGRSGFGVERGG